MPTNFARIPFIVPKLFNSLKFKNIGHPFAKQRVMMKVIIFKCNIPAKIEKNMPNMRKIPVILVFIIDLY